MKTCTKCDTLKPIESFSLDRNTKDGRVSECKACKNLRAKKFYQQNREGFIQKSLEYYQGNKNSVQARVKQYFEEHKEEIRRKGKLYRERNLPKLNLQQRAWAQANLGRRKVNTHNTRAKKRGIPGRLSSTLIDNLLRHQEGCCAACKEPLDLPRFDVDHIVALSKGGHNVDTNIQLLHPSCNAKKGKLPNEEFLQRLTKVKHD